MTYTIKIGNLQRELPLCPISEELSIASFVILGDAELSAVSATELLKKAPAYDYMITAEAKGIPLIHEMARQNGDARYLLARKRVKVYMKGSISVDVSSITTEGSQKLYLDGADAELIRGKRILLIDDVVSTGKSLEAVEQLVEKAGGIVCGKMAILAEGDAIGRDDLIYLEPLPLFRPDGTVV